MREEGEREQDTILAKCGTSYFTETWGVGQKQFCVISDFSRAFVDFNNF